MNLLIIDEANKVYHPFIYAGNDIERFIRNNVTAINIKNKTFLVVQVGVEISDYEKIGFTMNQSLHDRLVLNYNNNLQGNEKPLQLWNRNLT